MMNEARNRYEHSLLNLCERIHGSETGSGDGIPPDEAQRLHDWLNWRIGAGWEDTPRIHRRWHYENAVRALCFAALVELSAYLETVDEMERFGA